MTIVCVGVNENLLQHCDTNNTTCCCERIVKENSAVAAALVVRRYPNTGLTCRGVGTHLGTSP